MTFAFSSFTDFLNMGGYSFYVWTAYGLALLCLMVLVLQSLSLKKRVLRQVERFVQRERQLKKAKRS